MYLLNIVVIENQGISEKSKINFTPGVLFMTGRLVDVPD